MAWKKFFRTHEPGDLPEVAQQRSPRGYGESSTSPLTASLRLSFSVRKKVVLAVVKKKQSGRNVRGLTLPCCVLALLLVTVPTRAQQGPTEEQRQQETQARQEAEAKRESEAKEKAEAKHAADAPPSAEARQAADAPPSAEARQAADAPPSVEAKQAAPQQGVDQDQAPGTPEAPVDVKHGEGDIQVVGKKRDARSSTRLPVSAREVPATVVSVDARTLAERGVIDFAGALQGVAGVSALLTYGGFDFVTVRGFSDVIVLHDGIRDERHAVVDSAPIASMVGVDHVDVVKGPASVLNGIGAVGGLVNVVYKQPEPETSAEFSAAVGSYDDRRASIGMTGPVSSLFDDKLLYRVDLGIASASDFRGADVSRLAGTAALAWAPGRRQRLTLRGNWFRNHYDTDAGLPTRDGAVPRELDLARRYNTPYDDMRYDELGARLEYQLRPIDGIQIDERFSAVSTQTKYFSAETLGFSPDDAAVLNRESLFFHHHVVPIANQLEVTAHFHALGEHHASLGYDLNYFHWYTPSVSLPVTDIGIAGRETQPEPAIIPSGKSVRDQISHGVFISDLYAPHETIRVMAGVRLDQFDRTSRRDSLDPATGNLMARGAKIKRSDLSPSYRLGVTYMPATWVTPYASFTTSFTPSTEMPADGRQLEPVSGRQFELGSRFEALQGKLSATVALFQIDKRNLVIERPMMRYEQSGKSRSRGAELELAARLGGLSLRAGYAYTDAKYVLYEDSDGVSYAGKHMRFVPAHSATLWSTYRLDNGLGAGLGGRIQSKSFADEANVVPMTAYALVDASLFYEHAAMTLSLHAHNLLDENPLGKRGAYYTSAINSSQLTPGAPRTLLLQLDLKY